MSAHTVRKRDIIFHMLTLIRKKAQLKETPRFIKQLVIEYSINITEK